MYYRNSLDVLQYLFSNSSWASSIIYSPIKEYDTDGNWIYNEMWTADWWLNLQVRTFRS